MKPFNFVFIGRSGSGKGVQSELLMEKFPYLRHIVTGELFRNLSAQDTDTAHRINETLKRGALPFDDLATTLWMHEIAFTIKKEEGILLDGAPRRISEAENLERFLDFLERRDNTFIIFLDTTREEAERRLLARKRADDVPDVIKGRLDYYEEHVASVPVYYEKQGRLTTIDGNQSIEKVFADIVAILPQV